jgi:hypothetical protein
VLATQRGDATTTSSCPGSLGPSPWISRTSCGLQLDAELRKLEQGDLSGSDYCRKMKSTADGLRDLGFTILEHILVLNVLRGLPSSYEAVRTLLTHQQPPPTFL